MSRGAALRWAALGLLGLLLAAGTFLQVVLVFLAVMDPLGRWQLPRVAAVEITQVSRDMDGRITGQVLGSEDGRDREYAFSKEEAFELEGRDAAWVLFHYRAEGTRPTHFRLTPQRLLLEYPAPWVALALWGVLRLRRRQAEAAQAPADPTRPRKVWRDEYHSRAARFGPDKESDET